MIEKKFVKLGRSWGLIIPPVLLQLLQINPEKETVVISMVDNKIVIEKKSSNL
jgi:antitoxin component of MazEF toxin-antitoxin module